MISQIKWFIVPTESRILDLIGRSRYCGSYWVTDFIDVTGVTRYPSHPPLLFVKIDIEDNNLISPYSKILQNMSEYDIL